MRSLPKQESPLLAVLVAVATGIALGALFQVADASASDGGYCEYSGELGKLMEVRRTAGSGALESQDYWGNRANLRVKLNVLDSWDELEPPGFSLELEPESEP